MQDKIETHVFSTLFTAHNVCDFLSNEGDIKRAVEWCEKIGIHKVYLEAFRDGCLVERQVLQKAKEYFLSQGFSVSGCVTTTQVGKPSTGWRELISCYTDQATQEKLQHIFEYAAGIFDEIMIDDFFFTDCTCSECDSARRSKTVVIGNRTYAPADDSWAGFRCELMKNLSRDRVLGPAKRVNPEVKLIIKYPHWYEDFHKHGYDVVQQTRDFDKIWVGTETRDYENPIMGGVAQYRAYFIMRWLGGIGGEKCGGGWYDPYYTTEHTYIEQARQTILGGARESLLFCYGALCGADELKDLGGHFSASAPLTFSWPNTGPRNIEVLRENISELVSVSREVRRREPVGICAYRPPNVSAEEEPYIFDFVGMIGLPLVASHEFPADAPAAFFSVHALGDGEFVDKLSDFISSGKPVLLTDGLVRRLEGKIDIKAKNVSVLEVRGTPEHLLEIPQKKLDYLREPLLGTLGFSFQAPNKVALYLFTDGSWVIENFNDTIVQVRLNGEMFEVPARGWLYQFAMTK